MFQKHVTLLRVFVFAGMSCHTDSFCHKLVSHRAACSPQHVSVRSDLCSSYNQLHPPSRFMCRLCHVRVLDMTLN